MDVAASSATTKPQDGTQDEAAIWRGKALNSIAKLRSLDVFDRAYVAAHGSMLQRHRYAQLARHIKADAFAQRAKLAESYARSIESGLATAELMIPQETGIATIDLSSDPTVRNAIEEGMNFYSAAVSAGRTFPSKQSLEFVGSADREFDQNSSLFKLASSPLLLRPIVRYFGIFPILSGFGVTLARNNTFHRKSSQRLHFDPEDRTQIKAFVYLTDVDENAGPFMAVAAKDCRHLFEKEDFILDRQDDSVVSPGAITPFHGPAGTVIFCDTCRCLHAGAREGSRERLVLSIEYNIPSWVGLPLLPGEGDSPLRTRAIELETPDPYVLALLGRVYV